MTNEELADLITARTGNLRDHFDAKMSSLQTGIYGKLISLESDVLDLRSDVLRLRELVDAQRKALEQRG